MDWNAVAIVATVHPEPEARLFSQASKGRPALPDEPAGLIVLVFGCVPNVGDAETVVKTRETTLTKGKNKGVLQGSIHNVFELVVVATSPLKSQTTPEHWTTIQEVATFLAPYKEIIKI